MSISLRQAMPDDAALLAQLCQTVQAIHVAHHPDIFKPFTPDDPQLITFYENRLAAGDIGYIAEVDGEAVGAMLCQVVMRPENIFSYAQSRFHIDQMSVNKSHRGQGIGKLLMEKAFELARANQVDVVTLSVWAFNDGAQKFYADNGFENIYHTMRVKLNSD